MEIVFKFSNQLLFLVEIKYILIFLFWIFCFVSQYIFPKSVKFYANLNLSISLMGRNKRENRRAMLLLKYDIIESDMFVIIIKNIVTRLERKCVFITTSTNLLKMFQSVIRRIMSIKLLQPFNTIPNWHGKFRIFLVQRFMILKVMDLIGVDLFNFGFQINIQIPKGQHT